MIGRKQMYLLVYHIIGDHVLHKQFNLWVSKCDIFKFQHNIFVFNLSQNKLLCTNKIYKETSDYKIQKSKWFYSLVLYYMLLTTNKRKVTSSSYGYDRLQDLYNINWCII